MARIDGPACQCVDKLSVRSDSLQDCLVFRMDEVGEQFIDGGRDLFVEYWILYGFADAGGCVDEDHAERMAFGVESFTELCRQQFRMVAVIDYLLEQIECLDGIALIS